MNSYRYSVGIGVTLGLQLFVSTAGAIDVAAFRSAAFKSAETQMAKCGITAEAPYDNPTPQLIYAEKVYWRNITRNGQPFKYVVGIYGRSNTQLTRVSPSSPVTS